MANIVSIERMADGARNIVVDIQVRGDGSGEMVDEVLIDGSTLNPPCDLLRVDEVEGVCDGFMTLLTFGGSSPVELAHIPDGGQIYKDYRAEGGRHDPGNPGYNGTILANSVGLGSGDEGSFRLKCVKKWVG